MLTPQEQVFIAEIRASASPTGEGDGRTKSDLRRGQRRLLAIIDRLLEPAALVIRKPVSADLLAELKKRPAHIVFEHGAEALQAFEACRLIMKWHEGVSCTGQALRLENGYPVDHTDLNEAARLAKDALGTPADPWNDAGRILSDLLCSDCPGNGLPDTSRCSFCPRRRTSGSQPQKERT